MVRPLYQERILEVLVYQRDEAKLQIETSDAAFIGGRGSLNDAFAARTAVVQIEDRITMAELQVGTSKIQLDRWSSARANADLRMGARAASTGNFLSRWRTVARLCSIPHRQSYGPGLFCQNT